MITVIFSLLMISITLQHNVWYHGHVVDHLHRGQCSEHWDCSEREQCHDHTCVMIWSEHMGHCSENWDCSKGEHCQDYICVMIRSEHIGQCSENWDCSKGEHCHNHTCVKTSVTGVTLDWTTWECYYDADCGDHLCKDPCVGACGYGANCKVFHRIAFCACPSGFIGDAMSFCTLP